MAYWSARVILWLIAVCYGVFAFGHALNILGMGGFDWANAPLSWQLIDVLYLAADLAVVSQFALYWAVAPGAGAADAAGSAFPGYFVPFHVATIALVLVAVFLLWRRDAREAA